MSKVFIIGAAGGVGRRLVQQLTQRGHEALAMHRNPEQASELAALGGKPVFGDLLTLDVASLANSMRGSDVVVFSAGAGGKGGMEMTNAIDGHGLELAVAAAKEANLQRFLLVSAFPEAGRGKQMPERFENYMAVKKRADVHLAESGLDWVILRPGTLTDEPGDGKVRLGPAIPYGKVARDNVAEALAELVERPRASRIIIELTDGDSPVAEAIEGLLSH